MTARTVGTWQCRLGAHLWPDVPMLRGVVVRCWRCGARKVCR